MSLKLGPLMKINVLYPLCKLPDMIINRKRKETQGDFHVPVSLYSYTYIPVFNGELKIATIEQRALLLLLLTSLNAKALARIRFGQWIEPYRRLCIKLR